MKGRDLKDYSEYFFVIKNTKTINTLAAAFSKELIKGPE
jgi:hypothetical protein